MAQTKTDIDALDYIVNELKNANELILNSKGEMNAQLNAFSWDDEIGYNFYYNYYEKLRPIDNELIPAIQKLITHLESLINKINDYNKSNDFAYNTALKLGYRGHSAIETRESMKKILASDNDPGNASCFPDDMDTIRSSDTYKKRYANYLKALKAKSYDLKDGLTDDQIAEINEMAFKDENINVEVENINVETRYIKSRDAGLGGYSIGSNAYINKAYMEDPDISACGRGIIGAHECTHVFQHFTEEANKDDFYTKSIKEASKSYPKDNNRCTKPYHNNFLERDARTSQYAFKDACNQYAIEKYYKKKQ